LPKFLVRWNVIICCCLIL